MSAHAERPAPSAAGGPEVTAGVLAEFATPTALVEAAAKVRDAGYTRWDCHTPFPVHGLDDAMGIRPTVLPWITLAGGLAGAAVAFIMQWFTNAKDYPFIISDKPLFSLPANIPVAFELIVLLSAIATVVGMFHLNRLPQYFHPVFGSKRFKRASNDTFFISIEAADPQFSAGGTKAFLASLGGTAVEELRVPPGKGRVPRQLLMAVPIVAVLALIPPLIVAYARESKSPTPPIHIVPDMDSQPKVLAQAANPLFADGRGARPVIEGTVALEDHLPGSALIQTRGADGAWLSSVPVKVDDLMMKRGQSRYDIYCAPCHGLSGYGDGPVAQRADERQQSAWIPPTSLHTGPIRETPAGSLFNTISNGVRHMAPYGHQIPVEDRWSIVAYIRALQVSQRARLEDVPEDVRSRLR